jgi:plastocyanin
VRQAFGVVMGCLAIASCGGPSKTETATTAKQEQQPAYFQVDPATAGGVRGKITFAGKAPAAKRISMDSEEDCQKLHKQPVFDVALAVGPDKGVGNVFVYVKSGLEGKTFPPASEAVVLEQKGCQFVPRVLALRTGQNLAVRNSDPVSHNVHPMPKNNRDWNQQQPPQSADLKRKFGFPEVMIPVKCNVHAWMKSYIAVLDHPYFAITGEKGEFAVSNLPPGEYTVAAWHELFGETEQRVSIAKGATANLTFEFRTATN